MSFYFTPHPLVSYDPTGEGAPQLAIDITRRFKLQEVTSNSKLVFYDYQIKERDRPDVMAEKYYGNSRLDWLFFITNSIFDPYFQWPLTQNQFNEYMRQRYGSIATAQATNHHYEQIITPRKEYYSNFVNELVVIPERVVIVDQTTYTSLASTAKRAVSVYDYEESQNNLRRNIKILDTVYVPGLMRDFKRIFEE